MKRVIAALTVLVLLSAATGVSGMEFNSSGLLMLVSQGHEVESDYKPEKIQDIAKAARSAKAEIPLRPEAAEAYLAMCEAMKAEGIPVPYAVSGYRTYDLQATLYKNKTASYKSQGLSEAEAKKKAATVVAPPGSSEHQTGLALDISVDGSLDEDFADTKAGKWLAENSWRFGFVLRYPDDKSDITGIIFEPWHFRYVGAAHAAVMKENDWCLEEYITALAENAPFYAKIEGVDHAVYYLPEGSYPGVADGEEFLDYSSDNAGGHVMTVALPNGVPEDKGEWVLLP
ncbi:MAG: M15 family metallopeptidase [Clostridiales bacterium]|nr:M15 family metallopeptidase [Clostridiales bacterium]